MYATTTIIINCKYNNTIYIIFQVFLYYFAKIVDYDHRLCKYNYVNQMNLPIIWVLFLCSKQYVVFDFIIMLNQHNSCRHFAQSKGKDIFTNKKVCTFDMIHTICCIYWVMRVTSRVVLSVRIILLRSKQSLQLPFALRREALRGSIPRLHSDMRLR